MFRAGLEHTPPLTSTLATSGSTIENGFKMYKTRQSTTGTDNQNEHH